MIIVVIYHGFSTVVNLLHSKEQTGNPFTQAGGTPFTQAGGLPQALLGDHATRQWESQLILNKVVPQYETD